MHLIKPRHGMLFIIIGIYTAAPCLEDPDISANVIFSLMASVYKRRYLAELLVSYDKALWNNAAVVVRSVEARTTNITKNKPSMATIGTINFFIA